MVAPQETGGLNFFAMNLDLESYDIPNEYLTEKYRKFVEIFKEHFGEDRVSAVLNGEGISWLADKLAGFGLPRTEEGVNELMSRLSNNNKIHNIAVIVHYPTVLVENERGQTEPITDLFVKVFPFRGDGIQALRSSLSTPQAKAGYVHSHLPRLYDRMLWQNWCLGSGPIRNTLRALSEDNPDMGMVGLLCLELDTLVATESLQGGPYFRMEGLHSGYTDYFNPQVNVNLTGTMSRRLPGFHTSTATAWFKEFLRKGELEFRECNGKILLADSVENVLIKATNSFVRYLQEHNIPYTNFMFNPSTPSYTQDYFEEFIFEDGVMKILHREQGNASLFCNRGRKVITFKGKDFLFEINDTPDDAQTHNIWLFSPTTVFQLLYFYLIYINDRYIKSKNIK